MAKKIAINGFGRIGRMFYRALLDTNMLDGKVEVVAVNDLVPADNLAYLLKHDSIHGTIDIDVKAISEDTIQVGTNKIKALSLKVAPEDLPWKELGIDIVIESTGLFAKDGKYNGHLKAGAKKVLISAPSDDTVKTIVIGVNDKEYNGETIVSNASCTTNGLAPVVYVLLKEGLGIEEGLMTTIHSYTATQVLHDGPSRKAFRDGRAAALNLIPATTGAAKAVSLVLPELKGKLTGMAFRVPTADVSIIDLTLKTKKETSLKEINSLMKKASQTYLKGILGYSEEELVSSDFIHDARSSIYDPKAGIELNSKFFKLSAWYDNEWGYSCRLVDLLKLVI
jgi:glyceraldehyde 3-phosphate dehydrogenase